MKKFYNLRNKEITLHDPIFAKILSCFLTLGASIQILNFEYMFEKAYVTTPLYNCSFTLRKERRFIALGCLNILESGE